MKKHLKDNWFKVVIILAFIVLVFFGFKKGEGSVSNPFKNSLTANDPLSSEIIVCRFDVVSDFVKRNDEDIKYETQKSSEPINLTFAGLSGPSPMMKGNSSEVPILILKNTDDLMIIMEESGFGDVFFYTIFKKEKVAVWQKAYKLIDHPYAHVAMGYCQ